jgi:uncharacterized cupredoxin-like copper-binding protein
MRRPRGEIMMTTSRKRATAVVVAGTLAFLPLAGCGNDDDAGSTTVGVDGEAGAAGEAAGADADFSIDPRYAEYCEISKALDESDDFPSNELLESYRDAAPDEIRAELEYLVGRITELDDQQEVFALFGEPEFSSRLEIVEEFDAEHCGIQGSQVPTPEGVSFELDPNATRIDVSATDYNFEFEAPPAGPVSFVMTNDGAEPHYLGIGKLRPGVTVEEGIYADDPNEVIEWSADSNVALPGQETVLTFENLEPGEYAMVCFIPSPDGQPHAHLGMAVEFSVG